MGSPMTRCRSCGASIEFARTPADRLIPLDAIPDPDGNVVIRDGLAHVLGPMELLMLGAGEALRMPHHATCPDAADWKGPR